MRTQDEIVGKLRVTLFYLDKKIARLNALCPACMYEHGFNVDIDDHGHWGKNQSVWEFDGNYESPTFSPSMLANKDSWKQDQPICHSFLENGKMEIS